MGHRNQSEASTVARRRPQPEADPLAGLDDVEWASLQDAYGPAGGVPGMLRQYVASDGAERAEVSSQLMNRIGHQGVISVAAAAATVPFMLRLLPQLDANDLSRMLTDVACLCGGFLGDPWEHDPGADEGNAAPVRNIVAAELPMLATLLGHDSASVRAAAAYAVMRCGMGQHAQRAATVLKKRLKLETAPPVVAGLLFGLCWLDRRVHRATFVRLAKAASSSPIVRWAAAYCWMAADYPQPGGDAFAILVRATGLPDGPNAGIEELPLVQIDGQPRPDEIEQLVPRALRLTMLLENLDLGRLSSDKAATLLSAAFPGSRPGHQAGRPMREPRPRLLTPGQARVLQVLVECDALWPGGIGEFAGMDANVPRKQRPLRRFLEQCEAMPARRFPCVIVDMREFLSPHTLRMARDWTDGLSFAHHNRIDLEQKLSHRGRVVAGLVAIEMALDAWRQWMLPNCPAESASAMQMLDTAAADVLRFAAQWLAADDQAPAPPAGLHDRVRASRVDQSLVRPSHMLANALSAMLFLLSYANQQFPDVVSCSTLWIAARSPRDADFDDHWCLGHQFDDLFWRRVRSRLAFADVLTADFTGIPMPVASTHPPDSGTRRQAGWRQKYANGRVMRRHRSPDGDLKLGSGRKVSRDRLLGS